MKFSIKSLLSLSIFTIAALNTDKLFSAAVIKSDDEQITKDSTEILLNLYDKNLVILDAKINNKDKTPLSIEQLMAMAQEMNIQEEEAAIIASLLVSDQHSQAITNFKELILEKVKALKNSLLEQIASLDEDDNKAVTTFNKVNTLELENNKLILEVEIANIKGTIANLTDLVTTNRLQSDELESDVEILLKELSTCFSFDAIDGLLQNKYKLTSKIPSKLPINHVMQNVLLKTLTSESTSGFTAYKNKVTELVKFNKNDLLCKAFPMAEAQAKQLEDLKVQLASKNKELQAIIALLKK